MSTALFETPVSNEKPTVDTPLEITVSRDALLSELSVAAQVVETKTTIPILSNFLLVANEKGLSITATDMDQAIVTGVAAKVKKPGAIAIPARKLYDYVKLLPGNSEISMKSLENSWVQIRSGRSNTKMVGMARGNYPTVPSIGDRKAVKLPVYALKQLIAQTSFAISKEESRYTLNGALFGIEENKLFMVATDGHRLALSERYEKVQALDKPILLPKRAIDTVNTMLSATEETEVSFAYDEHTIYFGVGHRTYSSRRLSGQFPNYGAVIPRENNNTFEVSVAELERSLRRVATFADERSGSVKMAIESNTLSVSCRSAEMGESEETLDTPYSNTPIAIGFNSEYILDVLKALGGKGTVKFCLKDAQTAALLKPVTAETENPEGSFTAVCMPMRIG